MTHSSNLGSVKVMNGYLLIEAKGGHRKTIHEILHGTINLKKAIEASGMKKILLDYSLVTFEGNAVDVLNLTKFYKQWPVFHSIKSASVINKETLGIAKIWLEYCQRQGFNFRFFLDVQEAKNWLLNDN